MRSKKLSPFLRPDWIPSSGVHGDYCKFRTPSAKAQILCNNPVHDSLREQPLNKPAEEISAHDRIPDSWVAGRQCMQHNLTHFFRRETIFAVADHICFSTPG